MIIRRWNQLTTAARSTHLQVSVEFAPVFINNLRRGTLFDVDWHLVVSLDTGVSLPPH